MKQFLFVASAAIFGIYVLGSCQGTISTGSSEKSSVREEVVDTPQYFLLRPALEKEYGYSHAVKIGDDLKISGAVSMDDSGLIVGPGNMEQQMKNCYSDLEKILRHYGYTFDDVVAEIVYTTPVHKGNREPA